MRWSLHQHTFGTAQGNRTVEWLFGAIQLCSCHPMLLNYHYCIVWGAAHTCQISCCLPVRPMAHCCVSKISCRWYSIISYSHFHFIFSVIAEPMLAMSLLNSNDDYIVKALFVARSTNTRTPCSLSFFFFFSIVSSDIHLNVYRRIACQLKYCTYRYISSYWCRNASHSAQSIFVVVVDNHLFGFSRLDIVDDCSADKRLTSYQTNNLWILFMDN